MDIYIVIVCRKWLNYLLEDIKTPNTCDFRERARVILNESILPAIGINSEIIDRPRNYYESDWNINTYFTYYELAVYADHWGRNPFCNFYFEHFTGELLNYLVENSEYEDFVRIPEEYEYEKSCNELTNNQRLDDELGRYMRFKIKRFNQFLTDIRDIAKYGKLRQRKEPHRFSFTPITEINFYISQLLIKNHRQCNQLTQNRSLRSPRN